VRRGRGEAARSAVELCRVERVQLTPMTPRRLSTPVLTCPSSSSTSPSVWTECAQLGEIFGRELVRHLRLLREEALQHGRHLPQFTSELPLLRLQVPILLPQHLNDCDGLTQHTELLDLGLTSTQLEQVLQLIELVVELTPPLLLTRVLPDLALELEMRGRLRWGRRGREGGGGSKRRIR
jgi:hypothetical protein